MPFELPVEITGFGTGLLGVTNRNVVEHFSTDDILRAAVVAGHGPGGMQVDWRIGAWRTASIRLALNLSGPFSPSARPFRHPRSWQQLDPSEKASINNLLGNTVTKLLCERLLDAPRVWFLDLYGNSFSTDLVGAKRPDFFTPTNSGQWLSLEAKGRSNRPSSASLSAAKTQANALRRINGDDVAAHIVCWTRASRNSLCVRFHDPPPSGQGEINVEMDDLYRDYYSPVMEVMKASEPEVHLNGVTLYRFEAGDFRIGLSRRIEAAFRGTQRVTKMLEYDPEDSGAAPTGVPASNTARTGWSLCPAIAGQSRHCS